jgi:hypothetical protein
MGVREAAGGEAGHGVAKPDRVIHRPNGCCLPAHLHKRYSTVHFDEGRKGRKI